MQAIYSIQPWGPERDNAHAAMLATLYASAHTPKGKPRPKMADYMLKSKSGASGESRLNELRHYLRNTVKKSDV